MCVCQHYRGAYLHYSHDERTLQSHSSRFCATSCHGSSLRSSGTRFMEGCSMIQSQCARQPRHGRTLLYEVRGSRNGPRRTVLHS